jgi:hypothetical protein
VGAFSFEQFFAHNIKLMLNGDARVSEARIAALLSAAIALLAPATVGAVDPTKALYACLKSADEALAAPLLPEGTPQSAVSTVAILCKDDPARKLFEALELISTQEVRADEVVRRSATGIACHRFQRGMSSSSFTCSIGITVGGPFVDAIK